MIMNMQEVLLNQGKNEKRRREIYMQLVGKGVSRELIDEAFEESYEREDSTEAIRRLLEKNAL